MPVNTKFKHNANYALSWCRVWGKFQGTIYLVPTEGIAHLFQYRPSIVFSSILPAKERDLVIEHPKYDTTRAITAKVNAPQLLLSHVTRIGESTICRADLRKCDCKACMPDAYHAVTCHCDLCIKHETLRRSLIQNQFYLNQVSTPDLKAPTQWQGFHWKFANVLADSAICYGQQAKAHNLRHANNNFWGSNFNNSNNVATLRHRSADCSKVQHNHSSVHNAYHPENCRKQVRHTCTCACPDKNQHHPFLCSGCNCRCACICCIKQCTCSCICACCRKTCNCHCSCSDATFHQGFIEFLQKANESLYHSSLRAFVGQDFLVWNEPLSGIFISHEPDLLAEIGNPLIDPRGNKFVAGKAVEIFDGDWEITFQNKKQYFFSKKEIRFPRSVDSSRR